MTIIRGYFERLPKNDSAEECTSLLMKKTTSTYLLKNKPTIMIMMSIKGSLFMLVFQPGMKGKPPLLNCSKSTTKIL